MKNKCDENMSCTCCYKVYSPPFKIGNRDYVFIHTSDKGLFFESWSKAECIDELVLTMAKYAHLVKSYHGSDSFLYVLNCFLINQFAGHSFKGVQLDHIPQDEFYLNEPEKSGWVLCSEDWLDQHTEAWDLELRKIKAGLYPEYQDLVTRLHQPKNVRSFCHLDA